MAQPLRSDPLLPSQSIPRLGPKSGESTPKELLRFPTEGVSRLTLTAADRLVVSSAITGGRSVGRRRSMLPAVGLALLSVLAAIGAVSLYHMVAGAFLS